MQNNHKHTEQLNIDAKLAQGCEMTKKDTQNNHKEGLAPVRRVEGLLYPGAIVSESVHSFREKFFFKMNKFTYCPEAEAVE